MSRMPNGSVVVFSFFLDGPKRYPTEWHSTVNRTESQRQIVIPFRFLTEKLGKLVARSFWPDTGLWLHEKKLWRNYPDLLSFSCLPPISWPRSPKEVTLSVAASASPGAMVTGGRSTHLWSEEQNTEPRGAAIVSVDVLLLLF
jgi:hypothetical protein